MKIYQKLKVAALLTFSSTAFSISPPNGWYAGLLGDASRTSNVGFTLPAASISKINSLLSFYSLPPLTTPFGKATYLTGWGGGAQVGYRYCGWRFEGELFYNKNNINKIIINNTTISKNKNSALTLPFSDLMTNGNTTLGSALFNVYYDFYNDENDDVSWLPYIGLGIGYGRFQDTVNLNFLSSNPLILSTNVYNVNQKTSTAVGQAIIGIGYLFSDNFSGAIDYRYMTTRTNNNTHRRFNVQTLNLVLNYWFGDY